MLWKNISIQILSCKRVFFKLGENSWFFGPYKWGCRFLQHSTAKVSHIPNETLIPKLQNGKELFHPDSPDQMVQEVFYIASKWGFILLFQPKNVLKRFLVKICIFWLQNRVGHLWKHTKSVQVCKNWPNISRDTYLNQKDQNWLVNSPITSSSWKLPLCPLKYFKNL